ncbi:MAG: ABC transporter permease [Candidatus Wallbacteria bacterium]|nr:ABC transporter permease [Candidatus Wallbacteria bacterium]
MDGLISIYKRELKGYFATPVAYVFLVIFLFFCGFLSFQSGFFEAGQATLRQFFDHMPMLFLFFVPAIAMRLWAEERRTNSIEQLFTLPLTTTQAVLAKFLAALTVLALALFLTFPMVITVAYLGDPDPGPIITGYIGSLLLAGVYLAIGSFFSAATKNQVIAFILSIVACGLFLYAGSPNVLRLLAGTFSSGLAEAMETLSIRTRFEAVLRGVIELRDIFFFVLLTAGWLSASILLIEERKAA